MSAGGFEVILLLILLSWSAAALNEWRRCADQIGQTCLKRRGPGDLSFGLMLTISLTIWGEWQLTVHAGRLAKSWSSTGPRLTGVFLVSGLIILAFFDSLFLRLPNQLLFQLGCGGLLLQPYHNSGGKAASLLLLLLTAVILGQRPAGGGIKTTGCSKDRHRQRFRLNSLGGGDLKLLAVLPVFGGLRTAADLLLRTCLFLLAGFMLQALVTEPGQERQSLPLGPFCLAAALAGSF
ncbi:hypothetical protein HCH52_09855 [Oscillospiraceae bacterium HV4-5-C5C]|nr:hypothetical protein [Oscillospiraceae bacterium HV4-5-C5C]